MTREIQWAVYPLNFAFTARTSREVMHRRDTYLLRRADASMPDGWRYGEANFFSSLAPETHDEFLSQLIGLCHGDIEYSRLTSSAVRCGADMLFMPVPDTSWTRGEQGIPINGLIWMADKQTMSREIADKLELGFKVLKLKIGGIAFADELDLVRSIRKRFSPDELEIRLDANGSFPAAQALDRLLLLSEFGIHSIEQPIAAGNEQEMARLCELSPIPIALDEELIGLKSDEDKQRILRNIQPSYIILKPTLCGGIAEACRWRELAVQAGIGWWLTSALESSIGLYYLAAHVSRHDIDIPQGLGTGKIYTDNIGSCLHMQSGRLYGGPMKFDYNLLNSLNWQ